MNRGSMRQGLLSALQQVIIDMLPNGYPSITSTAARIGISVRTLQRRLAESGIKYGEFVAQVRFEQARRDLKNPPYNLQQGFCPARLQGHQQFQSCIYPLGRYVSPPIPETAHCACWPAFRNAASASLLICNKETRLFTGIRMLPDSAIWPDAGRPEE